MLSETEFFAIVSALKETFDLSSLTEFTVECNPESVTESLATVWKDCGVNRVSMGVQSFSDPHLKTLGRLHTAAEAEKAFHLLRKMGFDNVSLDLMAALPRQSEGELKDDLRKMIELSPEHLSVYLLKVEPGSSFGRSGVSEAGEDVQRRHYLLAHKMLTDAGYEHYEISNFAKPGRRARHNSVYWQGGEYLAFGPGAFGYVDGVRYSVPPDTEDFCRKAGLVPVVIEEEIDLEESLKEAVFLGLRLSDGVDISLIPSEKASFVQNLCKGGFATVSEGRLALTAEGFLISDYITASLLPDR